MKYFRPQSISEACALFEDNAATLLAGGTDLLPMYEMGRSLPDMVVDLKHISELGSMRWAEDGSLEIGSLVTVHELLHDERIHRDYPALADAANDFAAVQIRHRATIGGNICNASPAGDLLPPLYALNVLVRIAGKIGERVLPIAEVITGPGETSLQQGEILKSVSLPASSGSSRFVKLGLREAMAISVVNFAIRYEIDGDRFSQLRIAAGAVGPTVKMLNSYAEAVIQDPGNISSGIGLVDDDISPIDDIRASANYRSQVLKNLLIHTLLEVLESADD